VPNQRILGGAAAGALAAGVWAAQEPLDQHVFGVDYSDPELLAKPFGGSRAIGVPIHLANGAAFGAVYSLLAPRVAAPGVLKGAAAGMTEHLATWPLTRFLPGVKLWGSRTAFWQAVWRHLLFGVLLGVLEERFSRSILSGRPLSSVGQST
jgi:hypothetical protein